MTEENTGRDQGKIDESFECLRVVLNKLEIVNVQRLFSDNAHGLQAEGPFVGEKNLQLYFSLALVTLTPQQIDTVVSELTVLPIVKTAYRAPVPEDAGMELPTD